MFVRKSRILLLRSTKSANITILLMVLLRTSISILGTDKGKEEEERNLWDEDIRDLLKGINENLNERVEGFLKNLVKNRSESHSEWQ